MAHKPQTTAPGSEALPCIYKPDDIDKIVSVAAIQSDPAQDKQYHAASASKRVVSLLTGAFKTKPQQGQGLGGSVISLLARAFKTKAQSGLGLGELERLPLEITIQIILGLDLATCVTLRQTNRAVRQLVTGLSEYRVVVTSAFNVFDAVFKAGMASGVTLRDLYRLLCEHECMVCNSKDSSDDLRFFDSRAPKSKPKIAKGVNAVDVYRTSLNTVLDELDSRKRKRDASPAKTLSKHDPLLAGLVSGSGSGSGSGSDGDGDGTARAIQPTEACAGLLLFLPTMTRCCRPCLEESPRLSVVTVGRLCMAASLPCTAFDSALCKPLLGRGPRKRGKRGNRRAPTGTVPKDAATRILLKEGFPPSRVKAILLESGYLNEFSWVDDISLRSQFVVPMPFLGLQPRQVSHGFTCRGCCVTMDKLYKNLKVTLEYTNPLYGSKGAFMDHFKHCPAAIQLWKAHEAQQL